MNILKSFVAFAALSVALPAQAEFALGDRYTDADGDLIADIPTDPSELIDPIR
jgi:phosphonate transport system substrate-binding protein